MNIEKLRKVYQRKKEIDSKKVSVAYVDKADTPKNDANTHKKKYPIHKVLRFTNGFHCVQCNYSYMIHHH